MRAGHISIELSANVARIAADMEQARRVVGNATAGMERAANIAKAALGSIGAGIGLSQIIGMTDQYTKFTAQLRLATQSAREYAAAYGDVKRIATSSQQEWQATGMLYARIANGTRELGTSQKQVAAITETVNMALKVSGATAQESASAQLQLSQAFASGTLRGEEFNAVNEAAPRLMRAMADGMGVPVGALKAMATEGKITSAIMAEVLPRALEDLRKEAAEVQTIAGAFTVLKNNVMEFVGVQANASGGVAMLTGAIGMLANNLGILAGATLTLMAAKIGSWLAGWVATTNQAIVANRALAAANLITAQSNHAAATSTAILANNRVAELRSAVLAAQGEVQLALATNGLIPAHARAAAAETARIGTLGALAAAQRAASTATVAASGVIAALGGPVGAIITLLGIAATAWTWYKSKQADANASASKDTEKSTIEIVAELEKQNIKLRERIRLGKEAGMLDVAQQGGEAADKLASTLAKIDALKTKINSGQGSGIDQVELITLQGIYLGLAKTVGTVAESNHDLAASQNAGKMDGWLAKNSQYLTQAEKINAELKEAKKLFGDGAEYEAAAKRIRAAFADKGVAAGIKAEANAYTTLVTSIGEKIAANKLELAGNDSLTEAQKMTIKLDEAIASGKNKLTPKHIAEARALIDVVAAQETLKKSRTDEIELAKASAAANVTNLENLSQVTVQLRADAQAQQDHNDRIGLGAVAIAELDAKRFEHLASLKDEKAELAELIDWTGGMSQAYRDQAQALRDRAAATRVGASKGENLDSTKAKELLDILVAVDNATKSAADGMAASFGRVGSAIGGLTVALSEYGVRQQAIAAQMAAAKADPKNGPDKIAKMEIAAAHASAQAKIKSYGDMASAAKGFFKENSTGYKVMEGAEKAFRAAEMAMALQALYTKMFVTSTTTTAAVTGDAAKTASAVVSAGTIVGANTAIGTSAAAAGVATQAIGDPYTAWARMAAMAAVMVGLGFVVSGGRGGKGGMSAADTQKQQGTGSVFGDSGAKSASIARSLARLEEHSDDLIPLNRGMLTALRNIEASMLGLTNLVVRTDGITEGSNLGIQTGVLSQGLGGIMGKLLGPIGNLWGKTTQNIVDSGLQFGGSVNALQSGAGYNQYASVDKTKTSWFGLKKSTSNSIQTQGISNELAQQFGKVFTNLESALTSAAIGMGIGASQVSSALNNLVIETTSVSLKGLRGEELTAALNAVLSKTMDQMAAAAFPAMDKFRQVGEGYAETVIRLASNYGQLDAALDSIGMTFGATGLASLTAREDFIALAGGIDDLSSKASDFAENFLTEAERLVPVQKYVTEQLAAMSLAHLNSRDAFKAHLLSLNPAIAGEREQIAALLDLQGAFAKVYAATKDLSKSQQEIADERAELQKQIEQLTLSEVQLLAKRRAELDPSNRLLFDQVQALQAAREAQDAAKSSMTGLIDRMKSFGDSARSLRDGLLMGGLSTLTLEQQYAEARRQRDTTLAAAMGGDTNAQSNLSAMQTAFLTISQKVNGGDARYSSDFADVLRISDDVAKWSTGQIDTAQASLNVLNDQLAQLVQMNSIMQTIAQTEGPTALVGVPDYSSMGTANTTALVNEVKALNARLDAQTKVIEGLRSDQQQQTGDSIAAAEQISNRESEAVVRGIGSALNRGAGKYDNGVALS